MDLGGAAQCRSLLIRSTYSAKAPPLVASIEPQQSAPSNLLQRNILADGSFWIFSHNYQYLKIISARPCSLSTLWFVRNPAQLLRGGVLNLRKSQKRAGNLLTLARACKFFTPRPIALSLNVSIRSQNSMIPHDSGLTATKGAVLGSARTEGRNHSCPTQRPIRHLPKWPQTPM